MKKIMYTFLLGSMLFMTASSLNAQQGIEQILKKYYSIKDALVAGNTSASTKSASEFIKLINQFDIKSIPADTEKTVRPYLSKLLIDAGAITETVSITSQRDIFSSLSNNMILLVKELKISDSPVYVDYCPMKKSYWLSAEQPIKNPYYGNTMLTCGKITDTL